ncbi:hypothetical protein CLV24_104121 [Pontibacter ummariensis]|uniref:Uncharacterized protein n=1 Tax=Pontibacter ummariensis TaxID=1610492 RepID=A0A239DAH5_9BACT|nr:DUF6660 family protein [Pontibacter ummariensis]PRY14311.1 hypothetical protein CLV24_104121 [Pontibacter ummariensis]SNS28871.1 hypothetical protein SAMN06296052_104120 [Pontibacter ummariensis]
MKFLTVIWATLILALSCFPCSDGGAAHAEGKATVLQDFGVDQDEAEHEELCSPLCECKCCGGISLTVHFSPLAPPVVVHTSYISPYHAVDLASPTFPFWHPPKA